MGNVGDGDPLDTGYSTYGAYTFNVSPS